MEIREVLPLIDDDSFSDFVEHCVAQYSHDEENQHQKNEYVEQRIDGHDDCL